jgi:hypothetical protein
MDEKNSTILQKSLIALCSIAGRRTTNNFASKVMNTILISLQERYSFLQHVEIHDEENINVSSSIDEIPTLDVCKAIETAIRIVYMDLQDNGGLYFMKEFKESIGMDTIFTLEQNGIDLSILEVEQKHTFNQRKKVNKIAGDSSILGYSWSDVSNWKYDDHNKVCILYNKEDKILDKLNLDAIIKEHLDRITGKDDIDVNIDFKTERYQKEYELLNMLQSKDMDIDTALTLLQISEDELEHIVKRLMNLGFLEYVDVDVVKISEKGLQYISNPVS